MAGIEIKAEDVKKVMGEINEYTRSKLYGDNWDDYDAAERASMIRTLRYLGFGIERDEKGYILSVQKDGQIISAI